MKTKKHSKTRRRAKAHRVIRRAVRRSRRRARRARVAVSVSAVRTIRRRARGRNPGASSVKLGSMLESVTSLPARIKETISGKGAGIKSWGAAAGGAVGAIAGGTLVARSVMPLAAKFAPSVVASPLGARGLSALIYLGTGWAAAKFAPVSGKTKRAIATGAALAALLEAFKPGTVQNLVARIPFVGPIVGGKLSGIHGELADYVATALEGLSDVNPGLLASSYGLADYGIADYEGEDDDLSDYGIAGTSHHSDVDADELGCVPSQLIRVGGNSAEHRQNPYKGMGLMERIKAQRAAQKAKRA